MVWLKIWITWSLRLLWTHLGSGYHRAMVQNSLYQPVNVASKTFGLIQAISFDAGSTWYHLLSSPWQTRGPPLSPLHALLPFPPTNKQIRSFQWSMILSKYKKIIQIYFCALVYSLQTCTLHGWLNSKAGTLEKIEDLQKCLSTCDFFLFWWTWNENIW